VFDEVEIVEIEHTRVSISSTSKKLYVRDRERKGGGREKERQTREGNFLL